LRNLAASCAGIRLDRIFATISSLLTSGRRDMAVDRQKVWSVPERNQRVNSPAFEKAVQLHLRAFQISRFLLSEKTKT
jgi:hypothetical protein